MSSMIRDPRGRKRILFVAPDGQRKAVRLGKMTVRQAEAFQMKLDQLVPATTTGVLDDETARWVAGLDDRTHARLANVGLLKRRVSTALGAFIDKYLAGRADLKPKSRAALDDTRIKLVAFFDPKTPLRAITADQASDWHAKLVADGLSEASVKHHVGNAKGLFNAAMKRGLLSANPFEHLASGTTAATCDRYITAEEVDRIVTACPDIRWQVLFGLARLAGLRTPSETHLLVWSDVDWGAAKLNVRSPKTERHKGHASRHIPIVAQLMRILQDAFDAAPEGQERIVTLGRGGFLQKTMAAIVKRAEVEPWDRLWQTCRSSCERELAMVFPQYAVSRWIGHSITVSGKHYANAVPEELFAKAAAWTGERTSEAASKKAAQNPAQSATALQCNAQQEPKTDDATGNEKTPGIQGFSAYFDALPTIAVGVENAAIIGATGFEPATSTSRT